MRGAMPFEVQPFLSEGMPFGMANAIIVVFFAPPLAAQETLRIGDIADYSIIRSLR
jgi:hypothetical protein